MVEVIFQEVIFGQVGDICMLDMRNVRRVQEADIHDRRKKALELWSDKSLQRGLSLSSIPN